MKPAFLTDAQIDARALSHRRELGFRDEQGIDFMILMARLKARYPNFAYERVPDGQLADTEAQWDSETKRLRIPELVFLAALRGESRALMTIAHEVGHALLGHEGILHRAPAGSQAERLSAKVRAMEYQARRYAAALLIPNIEAIRHMSAGEMSEHFGVSMSAAMLRKSELK
ncbi:ImmA/IrrE family metallo-endopeptidase [Bosea sp. 2KB_26]|uniref:ImmA/IrrE family metallo-endopeptidase n=1 Tax=Bosea sp. 2KB_26 TaxID=3237475 RepID=UPI000DE3E583